MRKVCDMCGGSGEKIKYNLNEETSTYNANICPMCCGEGYVEEAVPRPAIDTVLNIIIQPEEVQQIIEERIRKKVDEEFSTFQNTSIRSSDRFDPRLMRIVENEVNTILMREFYPKISEYIEEAMRKNLPEILRLAVTDYFPKPEESEEQI